MSHFVVANNANRLASQAHMGDPRIGAGDEGRCHAIGTPAAHSPSRDWIGSASSPSLSNNRPISFHAQAFGVLSAEIWAFGNSFVANDYHATSCAADGDAPAQVISLTKGLDSHKNKMRTYNWSVNRGSMEELSKSSALGLNCILTRQEYAEDGADKGTSFETKNRG